MSKPVLLAITQSLLYHSNVTLNAKVDIQYVCHGIYLSLNPKRMNFHGTQIDAPITGCVFASVNCSSMDLDNLPAVIGQIVVFVLVDNIQLYFSAAMVHLKYST